MSYPEEVFFGIAYCLANASETRTVTTSTIYTSRDSLCFISTLNYKTIIIGVFKDFYLTKTESWKKKKLDNKGNKKHGLTNRTGE